MTTGTRFEHCRESHQKLSKIEALIIPNKSTMYLIPYTGWGMLFRTILNPYKI